MYKNKNKKPCHTCAATKCCNNSRKSSVSFFSFPKDVNRAKIWLMACGREDLLDKAERLHTSHRLCGTHFDNKMFLNDMRNRLQPSAVPTNFPLVEGSSTFDHTYSAVVQNICLLRCPINEEIVKSSSMDIEKNVSIKHKPSTITVLQDNTITPGNNIFHGEPGN
ncbi:unnamed protein product [Diabrotica balteata]|uniref:THAP-type domain-containing protein n=1 Tax=Diabrotica balteata TaxID=107213 RepID=A0A9N9SKX7_DIABA|nr:unnamed protein product [Diabrotica balteata]